MKSIGISSENFRRTRKNPEEIRKVRKDSGKSSAIHFKNNDSQKTRVISMAEKKPDMKFRAGTICATIWTNQGQTKDGQVRSFNSVSFEKSYKDKDGNWKNTKSLNVADLPKAALVLTKAYEHCALRDLAEEAPQISEETV